MGVIRQMSNQLTQVLEYGNPVLDAPAFDPSVFPEAAPSMGVDMGAMDPMAAMGALGPGLADPMAPAPNPGAYEDPMEDTNARNDMMMLLAERAKARKTNSDDFMAAAMTANK